MENTDEQLWRIAKKRAGFKKQLASYLIVNGFLWALWYFTYSPANSDNFSGSEFPWPVWCSLGWGIGLAFSYYNAYVHNPENDTIREYQKLKERTKN